MTLIAFSGLSQGTRCSQRAQKLIADPDNQVLLSIASLWEIAIKTSLGKLILTIPFHEMIEQQLALNAIEVLPVELTELQLIAKLPFHHRDPFDRLLVAQSLTYSIPLISADHRLDEYGLERIW